MGILIEENWINRTENIGNGSSDVYETRFDNLGDLYRSLQGEYGRCCGKVYIDRNGKQGIPVGWVFEKTKRYEDTGKSFKLETWITVHEKMPVTRREIFPMEIR